jgi:uncharacterized damage-inducible protein DinB
MEIVKFQEVFERDLFDILEEVFETHHGVFLDKGTTLLETLSEISAEEASLPIGNGCASIAAKVEHVIFYLEILGQVIEGKNPGKVNWNEIWEQVGEVTPAEWEELKSRLRAAYQQITLQLKTEGVWEQQDAIGGAMAILVHTAYHLGEIRQALCILRPSSEV